MLHCTLPLPLPRTLPVYLPKKILHLILPFLFLFLVSPTAFTPCSSQSNIPYQGSYYSSITSSILSDPRSLLVSLHHLLQQRTILSYSSLWQAFLTTDEDSYDTCEGNTIHDPYSNTCWIPQQQQCGNYQHEGECYNREHSWPKSWFGGMGAVALGADTDLHHLYPTDGWINGRRGNWPYAEVAAAGGTVMGNGDKLGTSITPGYTGTAFEPADSVKGDLARTYFYMSVMYADQWTCCESEATSRSHLLPWHLTMLKRWHQLDPVSASEMERNNDIYALQGNRNPFVDHPEWVDLMNDFIANPPVDPDTSVPTATPTPGSTTSSPTADPGTGTVTPTPSPSGVVTTSPPTAAAAGDVTLMTLFFSISPTTSTSTSTSTFRHDLIMELYELLDIPVAIMIVVSVSVSVSTTTTHDIIQVQLVFQPDDITYNRQIVQQHVTNFHQQYDRTNTTGTSAFTSTESLIFTKLITSSMLQIQQQSQRYDVQSCPDGTRVLTTDSCFSSSVPPIPSSPSSLSSSAIAGIVISVIVILSCLVLVGIYLSRRRFSFIRLSSPRRDSLQIRLNVHVRASASAAEQSDHHQHHHHDDEDQDRDQDQDQEKDYEQLKQQVDADEE